MDIERLILSLVSALIGFLLSQSVNLLRFFRRPRLSAISHDGVLSKYSGALPDEAAEVEIGIHISNNGIEPATGVRVYLTDIEVIRELGAGREALGIDTVELSLQSQFIAPGDTILAKIGIFTTIDDFLKINSRHFEDGKSPFWEIEADTRGKRWLRIHIFVLTSREDASLATSFEVQFFDEDINPVYEDITVFKYIQQENRPHT